MKQGDLYSIYHCAIEPGDFPAFEALVANIVAETAKEADTLTYEYVVNEARTEVHIVERYRIEGLLPHVQQTFAPFAEAFLALVRIEKLYVYGETTPEVRAVLDGFGAIYLTPFSGFTR